MAREETSQLELDLSAPTHDAIGAQNLAETFRRLYYHLYTNSKASRAERIMEDLSLLLLLKLALESGSDADDLTRYWAQSGGANDILIPLVRRRYPGLVDHQQRFSLGEDAVRFALEELDKVVLTAAPAHVIGEAFQALIGPRLRGDKGQFFTPRSLVKAMVKIVAPSRDESVLDPACGTGGFLVETHAFQMSQPGPQAPKGRLVGIDKDHDLCRLAAALLQIAAPGRATVLNLNSLDERQWQASMGGEADGLFDVVLTNPPFGSRIGVRDSGILKRFSFGHQWVQSAGSGKWQETSALCTSQDPQTLFLELCVRRLRPGGRLGIVLPEGLYGNARAGYIWEWLRNHGRILAVLDCPRTTFQPGTDTKTNVLFFESGNRVATSSFADKTWVGVALHCGHDRRGRTHRGDGRPHPNDFAALAAKFPERAAETSGWVEVDLSHRDYLVPRYYANRAALTEQEWELTQGAARATLGELAAARVLSVRKGHEVGSEAYGTGDIPFVRTSDLSNFEIRADPTVAVGEEVYRSFAEQQRLRPGNVLMVADGRYRIGTTAILTDQNYRCVVQSHLRILNILKPGECDPYELLFALNLPSARYRLRNLVFIQSTLGTLGKRLLELEIPILHGPGPWRQRVDRFKTILQERDHFLANLRGMTGPDYEL